MHVYVLVRGIHVVVRILSSFLNVSIFSCNQKQGSLADSEDWEDLLGFEVRGKNEKQLSRPEGSKWISLYYNLSSVLKKLNVGI